MKNTKEWEKLVIALFSDKDGDLKGKVVNLIQFIREDFVSKEELIKLLKNHEQKL